MVTLEAQGPGLRAAAQLCAGRVRLAAVDLDGEQLLAFDLDDEGVLRIVIADVIDGVVVERCTATLLTRQPASPRARRLRPLCSVTRARPLDLLEAA